MARVTLAFTNNCSLSVDSVVRDHQVYKETWNPYNEEKLMCNHDKREEAKIFEDHAVGTYQDSRLVGHVSFFLVGHLFCFVFIEERINLIFA